MSKKAKQHQTITNEASNDVCTAPAPTNPLLPPTLVHLLPPPCPSLGFARLLIQPLIGSAGYSSLLVPGAKAKQNGSNGLLAMPRGGK